MSLEQLLLLAFLIVIPLLERLIRLLRARTRGSPEDQSNTPVPQRPPRPPAPEEAGDADGESGYADLPVDIELPAPAPPPLAPPRAPAERLTSGERARARRLSQAGPAAPVGHPPQRVHGTALRRMSAVGDLRRAIVLMTILGPCRALHQPEER